MSQAGELGSDKKEEEEEEEEKFYDCQKDSEPPGASALNTSRSEESLPGPEDFEDPGSSEEFESLTEEQKESNRQQSLSLKEVGNAQFKASDWTAAVSSYTEALALCPQCFSKERAVLFSNRAAGRAHLDQKEEAITDCTQAIELDPEYVRALLRRAGLYEQTEKLDEALEDYNKVLTLVPDEAVARRACARLPQQIQERNEKLKEEMFGMY
ncbi:tetratricopeptide repeat protein 1 [Gouania willdenowi]|uniref:tetratricopeptide repeat protein 1 n=1 Tax=Gouania willdenowi TaxID=441366 RepID=UPI001054F0CF|nr:tetratricopeptide repeat protein 1 [Gouania willdenowi]XP_028322688.1 tetratricopeptide repeat protein 1 [Gouania willdenowi]XP_028322689.1 tetratricopeptide repeat protein 1 [Gouania willdenowi]